MVTVLLLGWLATARAAEPTTPVLGTLRWAPVPAQPGDIDSDRRLVQVPGKLLLRAQCGDDVVPHRQALYDSGLAEGPFSWPVQDESGWVFPPGPPGADTWIVQPATCDLYRLDDMISPEGAAHAEQHHTASEVAAAALASHGLDDDAVRFLSTPGDTAERWATLRPPGPHPAGYAHWQSATGGSFTIHGPRRLVIFARWLDAPRPLCLRVDDQTSCRNTGPDKRPVFQDGAVTWVPATHRPAGHVLAWHALLPKGPHEVAVDGLAEVRITGTWPLLYTEDARALRPTALRIEPGREPPEAATIHPEGTPASVLLFGPIDGPVGPDDIRWLPLDSPALQGATRVDAPGVFTLHLQPEGDGPCTVQFAGGTPWQARPEDAVQRFLWTGTSPSSEWPIVQGCRARVRVTGAAGAQEAWSGSRWWWAEPGGALSWDDPPAEAHLWIRHPEGRDAPYRLWIRHPSGRVAHWTIDPRRSAPDRWTVRGGPWEPAIPLRLEPGSGPVEVWADAPVIARLTGLAPPAPPAGDRDGTAPAPSPISAAPGAPEDLRALTRAIAAAPDAPTRATALLRRAEALQALGEDRLAWTDWERAAAAAPDQVQDNPLTDVLRQRTAAMLFGADQWVPADAAWIPGDAPAGTEAHAREGDWLGVAERIGDAGGDPRPWWRQAIVDGQVLTAAQRIAMYRDLVVHTPASEVDHPWLWPLRVLSTWEGVNQVRGTLPGAVRWPNAPPDGPDLYPDAWPTPHTLRLLAGYDLQVPHAGGLHLSVRCRSTRIDAPAEPCRFEARDPRGRVLANTTTDPWGTAGTLAVPESTATAYIHVDALPGVEAEVLQPAGIPRDQERTGWSVTAGGHITFEVLGPTVLRLEVWRPQPGDTSLAVEVTGPRGTTRTTQLTRGLDEVRVPVDRAGPVRVKVSPTARVWLIPSIRVPRATSRTPLPDAQWIAAGFATSLPAPSEARAAPEAPWVPPTGRPVRRPPATVYLRAGFGTANVDQNILQPTLSPSPRGFQTLGIASRPTAVPLWLDLEARGDESRSGGQFSIDGLAEWLAVQRTWNLWVLGEGQWVRGTDPNAPLATAEGRLRVTAAVWPWPRWDFQLRGEGVLRGITAGAWDHFAYGPDMLRLWSTYKQDHQRATSVEGRARYRLQPWLDTTLRTWLGSNQDFAQPPETWGAEARVEGGAPGLWWRAGATVEHRFADANRSTAYWSPTLSGRAAFTLWPDRDVGLQIRLSAQYRFHFQDLETLLELRVYTNRDRALRDVAPALLPEAHLSEWYQEEAALRRQRGGRSKR